MGASSEHFSKGVSTIMENNLFEMVSTFNKKFNIPYNSSPGPLGPDMHVFRTAFIEEELDEYKEARFNGDLEGQLDALVDMTYVILGTAYIHGFNFNEAFKRVHEANMLKIKGPSPRSESYDIIKPQGWKKPYLADLIKSKEEVTTVKDMIER
jgi:predicted HAD superfamily Cof-like phosphohydrolase